MCGILGLVRRTYPSGATGTSDTECLNVFKKMFVSSVIRGNHSSGAFLLNKDYKSTKWVGMKNEEDIKSVNLAAMYKEPSPAQKFLNGEGYKEFIKMFTSWTVSLVGHTRQATQGAPEDNRNNHPFKCGTVLGVHNGIIHNWREVRNKFNLNLKGSCDSEVIFSLIDLFMREDQMPVTKAITEMSKHVKGSMACAVANTSRTKELILFRRSAPISLSLLDSVSSPTLLFASEQRFIENSVGEEKNSTLKINQLKNIEMPNNTGVVINTEKEVTKWLEEAEKIEIH